MAKKERTRVLRLDGKPINLVRKRCHLMVCAKGCCCGHIERGEAAVPIDFYKLEYKRRKLRNRIQLTMNGCLGPCVLANVVLLFFDGRPIWLQSINSEGQIAAIYDYIEKMLAADHYLPPPAELTEYVFNYYTWTNEVVSRDAQRSADSALSRDTVHAPLRVGANPSILFLTHADTDLLALHHAQSTLPAGSPNIVGLSLNRLASPEHLAALLDEHARDARVVVARLLGGSQSVPGFGRLADLARQPGRHFLALSGTGEPDPELAARSNVTPAIAQEVAAYLQMGGIDNMGQCLRFLCDQLLMTGLGYQSPQPQPSHGVYRSGEWPMVNGRPTVGVLFYRSHWMSGNLAFIDSLLLELQRRGANVVPVFANSLKERLSEPDAQARDGGAASLACASGSPGGLPAAFEHFFRDGRPIIDTLISTMSFAMGEVNPDGPTLGGWSVEALARLDVPVIQAICCSTTQWQWQASARGLNPLDTAMNVALPEFDGRIITVPISFKEPLRNRCEPDAQGSKLRILAPAGAAENSPGRKSWEESQSCDLAPAGATEQVSRRGSAAPAGASEPVCVDSQDLRPGLLSVAPAGAQNAQARDAPSSLACASGSPTRSEAVHYRPHPDGIARVAGLSLRLARLRAIPNRDKKIAFILTNAAGKASRVGNAVGLDAPASLVHIFEMMREAGYEVDSLPTPGVRSTSPRGLSDALIHALIDRCSYDETFLTEQQLADAVARVPAEDYARWFAELPESQRKQMIAQWGPPPGQAYVHDGSIALAGLDLGNTFVALQPPRGYGMDPNAIYHRPDLPPPHNYYALYRWLRDVWRADAIVHVGKHGTLEWLPGKSVGLSSDCFPDSFLGDMPLFYPFIVNDPGEGAQAKRRAHAVIVDHMTPPMTTAETYGELAELTQLVDEYYQVEMLDPVKMPILQRQIWDLIQKANLHEDLKFLMKENHGDHVHEWDDALTSDGTPIGLAQMRGREIAHVIQDLDGYLCELGGAQIRDGLHILGQAPEGEQLVGTLQALTRLPNLDVPGLRAALAELLGIDLETLLEDKGRRLEIVPKQLLKLADRPLVTGADVVDTIDELGRHLLESLQCHDWDIAKIPQVIAETLPGDVPRLRVGLTEVQTVLDFVCRRLVPVVRQTTDEITNVLAGLDGRYVPAGPSGAPTRGMAHVLPTGRNFYAVDPRALPSQASWQVGQQLAREVLDRFLKDTGAYPETVGISIWGTSAMRTGGDDVAEVLALLGVRPVWHKENRRIFGIEVVPLEDLGRPRIDVVVRISGFFRDAFPHLIKLLNDAVKLVSELDEPAERNFVRKHFQKDAACSLALAGNPASALYRVFGSKPGCYGAGLLPLIDERNWHDGADLAETYVNWGGYAYTSDGHGIDARDVFRQRLEQIQVAVHNQDNREHDIFDSDDYFQFHGGMIASIRALTGKQPRHYFGDSHDPARPQVRDLKEEALRVFRTRVVNPKWLGGIMRHGYKGGLELAATVDYLFGYDATAEIIDDWMYEQLAQSYVMDPAIQDFLRQSNPWALHAISERLLEAAQRGMWSQPSAEALEGLRSQLLESESVLEGRGESPQLV